MSKHAIFAWPARVYFQDTDAGGVVYHSNYVNFMERARTEWLRTFGYSNAGMMQELGVVFVVRSMKLDYLKPAILDDLLSVTAQVIAIGRSSITVVQTVLRGETLLTEAEVYLVCVDVKTFKPVRVPDVLRKQWD
ncbi:MAG: tol-pal system-associated acyl-CoA thioesterase [Sideroxydans sp.]|nr:tol-pal system-associated acyl-CoA thioesterase [Sideroxydans sp.]NOT98717.1 tol-pal system-associated acyl-CoA thioesterase [Sideroxydans sp.]